MDPQYTLWALDGVLANTTTANSTGVLARFLEGILASTRDQEPVLFMLTQNPLPSMLASRALSMEIHFSWGCPRWAPGHQCWEASKAHQDVTSAIAPPSPGQRVVGLEQSPDAQSYYGKHLIVLTIDPHTTSVIGVHALHDNHSLFLDLKLLRVHHRTFLDTRSKAFLRSKEAK